MKDNIKFASELNLFGVRTESGCPILLNDRNAIAQWSAELQCWVPGLVEG